MAKHISEVLTEIEQRYVVVEDLITEANRRCAHLNRVCTRGNNRDLFADDAELIEWRGIRSALDVESERLEQLWQGTESRHG